MHEPALEGQALEVLLDVVAADHVEHDVDAALARDARDFGDEVLRPVVDRVVGAHRAAERRLVVAAGGREHRRRRARCASWIAVRPMPPVPPWISTMSPAARRPRSNRLFQTVKKFSGRLAASSSVRPARNGQAEAGRRRAVLGVAAARRQRADRVADLPVAHAFAQRDDPCPATSSPMMGDASAGGGYAPARCRQSGRLTPAYDTSISTSPGFGCGTGPSAMREHVRGARLASGNVAHQGRERHRRLVRRRNAFIVLGGRGSRAT